MRLTRPRRLACVLAALLPAGAACAGDCPPAHLLPAAAARDDLELAIRATEAALPDIYWHQTPAQWNAAKARARAAVAAGVSEAQLLRTLRELLYQVGEGHFNVKPGDALRCRARAAARFPLEVLWRDDGLFVVAGHGDAQDIAPGTRILAINGEGHAALFDALYRTSPHDGVIRTGVMRSEGAQYPAMRWYLHGDEPRFQLRLQHADGTVDERIVHPVAPDAPPAVPPASPLAQLQWLPDGTAYLYVPTFSNKRYRAAGAAFEPTVQALFDELQRKGAQRLVLDLRDNGGGSEPNESILFSYLVAQPLQKYAAVRSRGNHLQVRSPSGRVFAHTIYDEEELPTVRRVGTGALERRNAPPEGLMTRWSVSSPVYAGPLVVLAGGTTFSGGAELASMLQASRRALFVGEEVGGAYAGNTSGYTWTLSLPHSDIALAIPLLQFRSAWPEAGRGRGVRPHCTVQPQVGDIRLVQDPALQVAQALLAAAARPGSPVACPELPGR